MPDDTAVEDGNVGGASANVYQDHASLFFLIAQDRFCGCHRLDDQFDHLQPGFPDALVNIFRCCSLPDDDVEIRFERTSDHPSRKGDAMLAVNAEFLRDDVENLLAGIHVEVVHAVAELIDILLADLRFAVFADHPATVLHAFNVLPGNADIHIFDIHS